MKDIKVDLINIRMEISFKTISELRSILSFYQEKNLNKINIPCKQSIKKTFLLNSIKIAREEFPKIDIIPHFSILHEFNKNRSNTLNSLIDFIHFVKNLGCNEVLLVSGSQKRSTLDSTSALCTIKDNNLFSNSEFSIGVAFNPYLPDVLFEEEIIKVQKKIQSGLVKSIWIQFGTDYNLLEKRIEILKKIIIYHDKSHKKRLNIGLYGSVLVPSKQFISRFKYRPWKGVYCSSEFLESVELANNIVVKLLKTYKNYNIQPIIETNVLTEDKLQSLKELLQV